MTSDPNGNEKAAKAEKTPVRDRLVKLLKLDEDDVLSSNEERRTIVTADGGKYKLDANDKTVHHLGGPLLDGVVNDADAEAEARREITENAGR